MLTTLALLIGLSATQPAQVAAAQGVEVDVELILAVDMSGSMDFEEVRVQRAGYVNALKHPDFLNAVRSGLTGRIAISYFEWAGTVHESSYIPWQVVSDAEEAEIFAEKVDAGSLTTRRGTSISTAITYATALFEGNGFSGMRRVIDVSGDGPNNYGDPVTPARDAAKARGIVINGLAIMIRPSIAYGPLDRYYADCVIGGPGAFVLPVHKPEDFAVAIRRKLVMEVSGLQPAAAVIPVAGSDADCLIGERIRPGFNEYRFDNQ